MKEFLVNVVVPVLIATIPALIGFFGIMAQLRANKKEQKEQLNKSIDEVIQKLQERNEQEDEVLRCLLRTEILNMYFKHIEKDQKYLVQYEAENLHKMYDAYTGLNGNSFIKDIHRIMTSWEVRKN